MAETSVKGSNDQELKRYYDLKKDANEKAGILSFDDFKSLYDEWDEERKARALEKIRSVLAATSPQVEQPVTEEAAPLPEPPQEQPITGGQNTLNGQSTLDAPNSTADTETSPDGTLNSPQPYPPAQPSVESESKQSSAQQNRM